MSDGVGWYQEPLPFPDVPVHPPAVKRAASSPVPSLGALPGVRVDAEVTPASLAAWWEVLRGVSVLGPRLPGAVASAPGALRVVVTVGKCVSPRALSQTTVSGDVAEVRVAAHVAEVGELYAVAQLLHEAVHLFVLVEFLDPEKSYRGHGPRFCEVANGVAERLALGVRTHQRGGKGYVLAPQWPGLWGARTLGLKRGSRRAVIREAAPREELRAVSERLASVEREELALRGALRATLEDARAVERARAAKVEALRKAKKTSGGEMAKARLLLSEARARVGSLEAHLGGLVEPSEKPPR